MARRRYIGGDDEDGDYAAFLASRQPREDLFARALQLMQLQRQEKTSAEDRAFRERQAQAEEMYRQGQLAISERGETRQEKAAADALEREKTARIQEGMNRGEDVAYRTRQEQVAADKEVAAKAEKEQAQQQKIFEAAVDKGLIKPGDPEWEEWIKDLDPQAAARLTRVEGLKKEAAFKKGSEAYAQMPEKGRKALKAGGKNAATYLQEVGGPEVYKRILAEEQQRQVTEAPKPNLTPTVTTPQITPGTGNYGTTSIPTTYNYGTGTQVIPPVGGITGPVTTPAEIPTPAPLYNEPYANEADITNRINADPRFRPAEDIMMEKLRDWWKGPGIENAPGPPQYGSVTPQAPVEDPALYMQRGQQQINPEVYMPQAQPAAAAEGPGFVDWLMGLAGNWRQQAGAEQERLPYTYGDVLPPSQPLPTPIPQRGRLADILQQ